LMLAGARGYAKPLALEIDTFGIGVPSASVTKRYFNVMVLPKLAARLPEITSAPIVGTSAAKIGSIKPDELIEMVGSTGPANGRSAYVNVNPVSSGPLLPDWQ